MKKIFRTTGILAVAFCASAIATLGAETKVKVQVDKDVIQAHAPQNASQVMKMSVVNKAGEKLGAIDDLAIEVPSGRIAYVLVSSGGVLGVGSHLRPIPPAALMAYVGDAPTFSLDIPKERWDAAPTLKKEKGQVLGLNDETQCRQTYTYYNQEYRKEMSLKAGSAEAKIDLKQTGRLTNDIRLASDLIGKQVFSRDQQNLGKLNDFLVDLTGGQTTFAIVGSGHRLVGNDQAYAIAPRLLNFAPGKQFTVAVDRNTLDQAGLLERSKANMPDILRNAAGVYRYREEPPSTRTGRDRDKDGVLDKNQPPKN